MKLMLQICFIIIVSKLDNCYRSLGNCDLYVAYKLSNGELNFFSVEAWILEFFMI